MNKEPSNSETLWLYIFFAAVVMLMVAALLIYFKIRKILTLSQKQKNGEAVSVPLGAFLNTLDSRQVAVFLDFLKKRSSGPSGTSKLLSLSFLALLSFWSFPVFSQTAVQRNSVWAEGGVIITLILILLPILGGLILMMIKVSHLFRRYKDKQSLEDANQLADLISRADQTVLKQTLMKRKNALDYNLTHDELSGKEVPDDSRGLLRQINSDPELPVVAAKKRAIKRPEVDPALSKLILWFIGCATFWLLFGTTVGEYLGIKFVAPDTDHLSWLSFGRLRPVHTNAVFWGWSSLGMIGLGLYVVPRVSNGPLANIKMGWYALWFINAAVVIGSLCLMAGINNGGGEYREYTWPVMMLFGIGVFLTLINFMQTIARRTTKEIYISNWYIVASVIFVLVIALVAYLPWWQDGLGETIIQGYYMHQGVGMWFMLFTLGIVYYFLPQQLNKPIYSYSLGILAFWTQILFYTVIGTHHFVFSAIPWWLQTVAILGSVGMIIPVAAGTTNFLLTFKGAWHKVPSSYTLPFFIVGIIFYFTGSLQGTAEAFRSTNMIWHFTDFTVAHSHLTMYGIICFFLWAGIYALVPRLTGKEAPQITVGAHFWLALIGLLFYTIPLMYGSTLKGLMWMEGKPFMESVVLMAPYWLWRAIGGSLMWLSHLFFAYNFYKMLKKNKVIDVRDAAIKRLDQSYALADQLN